MEQQSHASSFYSLHCDLCHLYINITNMRQYLSLEIKEL